MFYCSFTNSGSHFELHEAVFDRIEDIYKRSPKLQHLDHLIDKSRYFIEFGQMASKREKSS